MEQGIRLLIVIWLLTTGISICYAQDYSTWGEIYDYEVGDIFHHEIGDNYGVNQYFNTEILDKSFSAGLDTVLYTQFVKWLWKDSGGNWIYEEWTETKLYGNINALAIVDTVYTSNMYNGRKISDKFIQWNQYDYEQRHYVDGCGIAYKRMWSAQPPYDESETNLIYYKKGDEEWGTPHIIVSTDDFVIRKVRVKSYPNPFTTSIAIEYELAEPTHVQLTIYNAIGETIQVAVDRLTPVGKHTFTWSAESLPEGLYYGVLRSGEGVSVVKMVKQ